MRHKHHVHHHKNNYLIVDGMLVEEEVALEAIKIGLRTVSKLALSQLVLLPP